MLRLVDDLGFDPVDGGDLDNSWRQQPGTPAYCRDLEATALRRALAEADRSRIAEYRAEREAQYQEGNRSAETRRLSASVTRHPRGEMEMLLESKNAVAHAPQPGG